MTFIALTLQFLLLGAVSDVVTIPAGTYVVGCSECSPGAQPVRSITLAAFEIGKTEVSVADYTACVDAAACVAPPDGAGSTYHDVTKTAHPVTYVTWQEATQFCAWAGQRLCTDDEWEAASRGTANREFPWGASTPSCAEVVAKSRDGACGGSTAPVGSQPAGNTPEGVAGLLGNVAEWVSTCSIEGSASCTSRFVRGGDYGTEVALLRSSLRQSAAPYLRAPNIGFRCCRDK